MLKQSERRVVNLQSLYVGQGPFGKVGLEICSGGKLYLRKVIRLKY